MKKNLSILFFTFFICFIFVGVVGASEFDCKIGNYTVTYNTNGEIKAAKNIDGNLINKYLSSYFKPKSVSECPTDATAKVAIIDGGRTFYVAKKDETFSSDSSDETYGSNSSDEKPCYEYRTPAECKTSKGVACVWVGDENSGYCNVDNLTYVACGDAKDIPTFVPKIVSYVVNLFKIATPIILIFISIISLVKALAAQKDDEIKKAQASLIKKLIAAALVFFVISIVQFIIFKVADSETKSGINEKTEDKNISSCLSCFLNNDCDNVGYFKTNIAGVDYCTSVYDLNDRDECTKYLGFKK